MAHLSSSQIDRFPINFAALFFDFHHQVPSGACYGSGALLAKLRWSKDSLFLRIISDYRSNRFDGLLTYIQSSLRDYSAECNRADRFRAQLPRRVDVYFLDYIGAQLNSVDSTDLSLVCIQRISYLVG